MNGIKYIPLVDIVISHSYYKDGNFRDVKVLPDKRSHVFMLNTGLLLRESDHGFSIYYQSSFSAQYIKELTSFFGSYHLRFSLYTLAENFVNFTEMSLSELVQFQFSNKKVSEVHSGLLLPLQAKRLVQTTDIGYVDIYLDELLEGNKITTKQYEVTFSCRSTQWNYYVVSKKEDGPGGSFQIEDSKGRFFNGPEQSQLPNGIAALKFSSGNHVYPIKERPEMNFRLRKKNSADTIGQGQDEDLVIEKLPTASAASIESIQNLIPGKPMTACSSIYVYL